MLKRILCGASLLIAANASFAETLMQEFTIETQTTDISEVISFDLFDTVGGTRVLESVAFSLSGAVDGTAQVENLNSSSTAINATLAADMFIGSAFDGELVGLAPTITESGMVSGFDGEIDFAGASGLTFLNLNANQFGETLLTDAVSLANYTGTGTSTLDFWVNATSVITGGGNLTSRFLTSAGGTVNIIYTFSDDLSPADVSEPAFLALIGMGLLGFRRFKRNAA